jgi:hypothetical protein
VVSHPLFVVIQPVPIDDIEIEHRVVWVRHWLFLQIVDIALDVEEHKSHYGQKDFVRVRLGVFQSAPGLVHGLLYTVGFKG